MAKKHSDLRLIRHTTMYPLFTGVPVCDSPRPLLPRSNASATTDLRLSRLFKRQRLGCVSSVHEDCRLWPSLRYSWFCRCCGACLSLRNGVVATASFCLRACWNFLRNSFLAAQQILPSFQAATVHLKRFVPHLLSSSQTHQIRPQSRGSPPSLHCRYTVAFHT